MKRSTKKKKLKGFLDACSEMGVLEYNSKEAAKDVKAQLYSVMKYSGSHEDIENVKKGAGFMDVSHRKVKKLIRLTGNSLGRSKK